MFCENYEEFVKTLESHGFHVHTAADGAQAKKIALELAEGAGTAGYGGSVTVQELGIYEELEKKGVKQYWHWKDKEHMYEMRVGAIFTDVYFASVNGISGGGSLINIDGTGNRAASQFFGPKKVVLIIGKNKYGKTFEEAMYHAKNVAAPVNAKRLGRKTPCAVSGKCENCNSPERICRVTTILDRPTTGVGEMHLILVDEELGF